MRYRLGHLDTALPVTRERSIQCHNITAHIAASIVKSIYYKTVNTGIKSSISVPRIALLPRCEYTCRLCVPAKIIVEELAEEAALDLLIGHALATGSIGVLPVLLKGVEGGHEARAL
jgi:hypothetical protein